MNGHVHSAKYMDYVFAARFDQMDRCYGIPFQEFIEHGYSWVVKRAELEYKRSLKLGDEMRVLTHVSKVGIRGAVSVAFKIFNHGTSKLCCSGEFDYVMISIETGRPVDIPDWIAEKYSI